MSSVRPLRLVFLGLFLLLAGSALPFLMVLRLIPLSFAAAFVGYGASVIGLALGLYGLAQHVLAGRGE